MAVIRPIAAVLSAIFTGLLTAWVPEEPVVSAQKCGEAGCGCSSNIEIPIEVTMDTSCCSSGGCDGGISRGEGFYARTLSGLRYALVDMVEDLYYWLLLGLLLAALVTTVVPPMVMAEWGSGLPAMLMMVLIGVPMYICATASTPVATALLFAGISPGTVLVFLLAGPATNIATIGVIRQEMGRDVVLAYLAGITLSAIILGLLTDWFVAFYGLSIQGRSVMQQCGCLSGFRSCPARSCYWLYSM